jgi:hypothetical protein
VVRVSEFRGDVAKLGSSAAQADNYMALFAVEQGGEIFPEQIVGIFA